MLPSLLGYARSIGIDTRWLVIAGNPDFFRVTKRIHHALHGSLGDVMPLDERAHQIYEETLRGLPDTRKPGGRPEVGDHERHRRAREQDHAAGRLDVQEPVQRCQPPIDWCHGQSRRGLRIRARGHE
jgi:hypothetical protein